jgi:hypothetical protein
MPAFFNISLGDAGTLRVNKLMISCRSELMYYGY